jgi:hypothetical protein
MDDTHFLNSTELLLHAPIPLKPTLNMTSGNFTFAYDTPANMSDPLRGVKFHNFTDGRDFHYRPDDIEIDADIEINIIIEESCEICTDRSDLADYQVVTFVCVILIVSNCRLRPSQIILWPICWLRVAVHQSHQILQERSPWRRVNLLR